jgi:biotin carboxyl carrier protein
MVEALIDQIAFQVARRDGAFLVNGKEVKPAVRRVNDQIWMITYNGKEHAVFLQKYDPDRKEVVLGINGKRTTVKLATRADKYLKSLGMESNMTKKLAALKAPMPGLVHSLKVEVGQEVKKGDALLILEAMKMENVIKATGEGVVAKIHVEEKTSVEKNQLIITFK